MRVGSLFSGIGGFDLGFERAGMESAFFVECEPYCQRVLAKHWPEVPIFDDVREVTARTLPAVDILCGGFPCQDLSLAGRGGGGLNGTRSGLWSEYARLIGELAPRYVVVENVSVLRSRGLERVLGEMAALGYDAEWDCIPASAFGAPHRRDRVWIVAYPALDGRGSRRPGRSDPGGARESKPEWALQDVADAEVEPLGAGFRESKPGGLGRRRPGDSSGAEFWWGAEPDVGRGLDGFSAWLDAGRFVIRQPHQLLSAYGHASGRDRAEAMRVLRGPDGTQELQRAAGGCGGLSTSEILFAYVRELAARCDEGNAPLSSAEAAWAELRSLRGDDELTRASRRPRAGQQPADEHSDPLQAVSRLLALDAETAWLAYRRSDACPSLSWEAGIARVAQRVPDRLDRLRSLGNALVPQIAEWIGRSIMEYEGAV